MNRVGRLLFAVAATAALWAAHPAAAAARAPQEPAAVAAPAGCIAAVAPGEPIPASTCPDGSVIGVDGWPHDPATITPGCPGGPAGPPSAGYHECPTGDVIADTRLIPPGQIPAGCAWSTSDDLPTIGTACPDGSSVGYPPGCPTANAPAQGLGVAGTICPTGGFINATGAYNTTGDRYSLPHGCRGSANATPPVTGSACPDGTTVGADGRWHLAAVDPATSLCTQHTCTRTGEPDGTQPIPAGCPGSTSAAAPVPGTACPDGTIVGSLGGTDAGDDPATGSGIDSLLPVGTFTDGNAPTLAETYPVSAYTWSRDYGLGDTWMLPVNWIVNFTWFVAVLTATVAEYLFQLILRLDPTALVGGGWLHQLTARLADAVLVPFLAVAGAVAALRALVQWRAGRAARSFGILAGAVVAVAVTMLILGAPERIVATGQDASSELIARMAGAPCDNDGACTQPTAEQQAMFPTVAPTFQQQSATTAATRQAVDRFHYAFIVVPWATGEFGTTRDAGDGWAGRYLDARVNGDDTGALLDEWKSDHSSTSQKNWVNGKNLVQRGVIAVIALIAAIAMAVLLIGCGGIILAAYIGLLFILVFGAFAGTVAPLSERGFQLWKRWIAYLAAQFVKRTVIVAFVLLLVEIVAAINARLGQLSYFVNVIWMIFTLVAAFTWRRTFVAMFTQLVMPGARATSSGSAMSALGAGAAIGMMRRNTTSASAAAGTGAAGGGVQTAGGVAAKARLANPYLAAAAVVSAAASKTKAGLQDSAAPLMLDGQPTRSGNSGLVTGMLAAAAVAKPGAKPANPPPAKTPPAPPPPRHDPGDELPPGPRPPAGLPAAGAGSGPGPQRPTPGTVHAADSTGNVTSTAGAAVTHNGYRPGERDTRNVIDLPAAAARDTTSGPAPQQPPAGDTPASASPPTRATSQPHPTGSRRVPSSAPRPASVPTAAAGMAALQVRPARTGARTRTPPPTPPKPRRRNDRDGRR